MSDLEHARVFYEKTLGLRLKEAGPTWLIFDLDGLEFVIMGGATPIRPPEYGSHASTVLCLETPDIETSVKHLRRAGVYFLTPIKRVAQGAFAAFKDPDGNVLELIQRSD